MADEEPDLADEAEDADQLVERAPPAAKQAIVVVHGMGEQRPMQTLREFVYTVWSEDTELTEGLYRRRKTDPDTGKEINKSWDSPDNRTGSHELRRIKSTQDINKRQTDFYELYWSDITQGTTVERLRAWVTGLLLRRWSEVPKDVRKLYVALWIAFLLIVGPGLIATLMKMVGAGHFLCLSAGVWAGIAAVMAVFVSAVLLPYFGDVAIYVQAFPGTIAKRKETRDRGLELLSGLMEDKSYDRIVVVAHSLGTIVAYDLLQILWTRYAPHGGNARQDAPMLKAFRAVGKFAVPITAAARKDEPPFDATKLEAFRQAQWNTYAALRTAPPGFKAWKISDFVTFGSPLTHAEFLMTRNAHEFARAIDNRLFSACPPVSERDRRTVLYKSGDQQFPHHAAMFSAMRWTNVYDRGNGWITGDPISGSMTENFGSGVKNIRVKLRWKLGRIFTHTEYWSRRAVGHEVRDDCSVGGSSRDVLRQAVDLRRLLEPASGGDA